MDYEKGQHNTLLPCIRVLYMLIWFNISVKIPDKMVLVVALLLLLLLRLVFLRFIPLLVLQLDRSCQLQQSVISWLENPDFALLHVYFIR